MIDYHRNFKAPNALNSIRLNDKLTKANERKLSKHKRMKEVILKNTEIQSFITHNPWTKSKYSTNVLNTIDFYTERSNSVALFQASVF